MPLDASIPVLEVRNLTVDYRSRSGRIRALEGVSFQLWRTMSYGVIGPSGSGKTTLALACAGVIRPTSGQVFHLGSEVSRGQHLFRGRRSLWQVVFQNPYTACNPSRTVYRTLQGLLRLTERTLPALTRPEDFLELVHLPRLLAHSYPGTLSGGECQRFCIACALAAGALGLILDEPFSMLDVIARQSVVTALKNVRAQVGCAFLLISHQTSVLAELCDHILSLSSGHLIEFGKCPEIFDSPQHEVTRSLLEAN